MAIKPTDFHKKRSKPLPEYEVIDDKEKLESAPCCVCDGPGSTCNPENPTGAGSLSTSAGAQIFAFWQGR